VTVLPGAAPEAVHRLVAALGGGDRLEQESGVGPFAVWLLRVGRVVLEVRREYHSWSLFLRSDVSGVSPISFWRVAVAGGTSAVDPDVEADAAFLIAHAVDLSNPAAELEERVGALRVEYEAAMRRRYGSDE
jgi:hypothetical protein